MAHSHPHEHSEPRLPILDVAKHGAENRPDCYTDVFEPTSLNDSFQTQFLAKNDTGPLGTDVDVMAFSVSAPHCEASRNDQETNQ